MANIAGLFADIYGGSIGAKNAVLDAQRLQMQLEQQRMQNEIAKQQMQGQTFAQLASAIQGGVGSAFQAQQNQQELDMRKGQLAAENALRAEEMKLRQADAQRAEERLKMDKAQNELALDQARKQQLMDSAAALAAAARESGLVVEDDVTPQLQEPSATPYAGTNISERDLAGQRLQVPTPSGSMIQRRGINPFEELKQSVAVTPTPTEATKPAEAPPAPKKDKIDSILEPLEQEYAAKGTPLTAEQRIAARGAVAVKLAEQRKADLEEKDRKSNIALSETQRARYDHDLQRDSYREAMFYALRDLNEQSPQSAIDAAVAGVNSSFGGRLDQLSEAEKKGLAKESLLANDRERRKFEKEMQVKDAQIDNYRESAMSPEDRRIKSLNAAIRTQQATLKSIESKYKDRLTGRFQLERMLPGSTERIQYEETVKQIQEKQNALNDLLKQGGAPPMATETTGSTQTQESPKSLPTAAPAPPKPKAEKPKATIEDVNKRAHELELSGMSPADAFEKAAEELKFKFGP